MPVRYAVDLELEDKPQNRPEALHGLVGDWLDPRDRHTQNRKPWALAPLREIQAPLWRFEVGLLDDESETRLLDSVSRGPAVRLDGVTGQVTGAGGEVPRVLLRSTWAELVDRSAVLTSFRFEFLTPTTFRSGPTTIPLPIPTLVFGHFRSRWNTFAPADLRPFMPFEDITLLLSHLEIATPPTLWFKKAPHVGFVGRVIIEARSRSPERLRALDALASIAPFSGTGAGTTFGMGVTRYVRI
ncbi:MAG: CRISPR system precrRNA processing endoribonuclease RAMP protein Cas6 [Actinomycetota bacterium]